ncbi:MAG: hypothetical protein GC205_09420 [Bacteroidetes bacterium]|nr:hypothetical protein [Bacteroidota bacterium]
MPVQDAAARSVQTSLAPLALSTMTTIALIRKIKAWFIRLSLHRVFEPFATLLLYAGYLSRLSAWAAKNTGRWAFNDFYNPKPDHKGRIKLYEFLRDQERLADRPITYLEFGVGRGNSMRWWTAANTHPDSRFYGFDTFEGLPERYGTYAEGTFSQGGKFPDIPDARLQFVKGLFQDSLPGVLPGLDFSRQTIVHIDGDLYTSALYPLAMLYPKLKEGDFLLFDEFGVPLHEFRAYEDFTRSFRLQLEPVGAINNYLQVVFKLTKHQGN